MELAAYKVAASDVQPGQDQMAWWKEQVQLPSWQRAVHIIAAILPSSAAAERVFFLLEAATSSQQQSASEDQLELAVVVQYSRSQVRDEL